MPYVGADFDEQDPGEVIIFSFDFARELSQPSETLLSATWNCAAVDGVDAGAATRPTGSATINGLVVSQRISGGVAGVNYRHLAQVVTSAGQTLQLWSHCLVSAPG